MNIVNFDDWEESNSFSEGSGRSEKVWLQKGNQIGLFKFPKATEDGSTFEHVSEHLAAKIANTLHIPCARVDIGTRNGRMGSMSYLVMDYKEEFLLEGLRFITWFYSDYDENHLIDRTTTTYYSIDMVFDVINQLSTWFDIDYEKTRSDFIRMLTLDFLIGNSDRHHSNWAFIINKQNILRFSPLYDNGSSLCALERENKIPEILLDKRRLEAMCTTKSKTLFYDKRGKRLTHQGVFSYLFEQLHYPATYPKRVCNAFTPDKIDSILLDYQDIYSKERIELIRRFLNRKVVLLRELCERRDSYEESDSCV